MNADKKPKTKPVAVAAVCDRRPRRSQSAATRCHLPHQVELSGPFALTKIKESIQAHSPRRKLSNRNAVEEVQGYINQLRGLLGSPQLAWK